MFDNLVGGKFRKKKRIVRVPMGFEADFLHRVADVGAARLVVGNEKRAEYTKWRLRAMLAEYPWKDGICIAVRDNSVIGWMVGKWECRRLSTKIEEFVYREENTLYCTIWSSRDPFDDARGVKAWLNKATGSAVPEMDRFSESKANYILKKFRKGEVDIYKARALMETAELNPDDFGELRLPDKSTDVVEVHKHQPPQHQPQSQPIGEKIIWRGIEIPDNWVIDPVLDMPVYKEERE